MKAVYAGSFDPFTMGHLDIAKRALDLFSRLVIAIGVNPAKKGIWTAQERASAIKEQFRKLGNVEVMLYEGLTIDFAKKINADFLIRGVRNISDFEFEKSLADTNRKISGIETLILFSDPGLSYVSSSMVRELLQHGYDVTEFLGAPFPKPEI